MMMRKNLKDILQIAPRTIKAVVILLSASEIFEMKLKLLIYT
jgi:hypothetical protein